jgi:hypothetical protein
VLTCYDINSFNDDKIWLKIVDACSWCNQYHIERFVSLKNKAQDDCNRNLFCRQPWKKAEVQTNDNRDKDKESTHAPPTTDRGEKRKGNSLEGGTAFLTNAEPLAAIDGQGKTIKAHIKNTRELNDSVIPLLNNQVDAQKLKVSNLEERLAQLEFLRGQDKERIQILEAQSQSLKKPVPVVSVAKTVSKAIDGALRTFYGKSIH